MAVFVLCLIRVWSETLSLSRCRLFDAINHESGMLSDLRLERQSELLLQCRKDRWGVCINRRRLPAIDWQLAR